MKKQFKFAIAQLLDRSDMFCWAALVTWADPDFDTTLRDCFEEGRNCVAGPGECWCGKFPREKGGDNA